MSNPRPPSRFRYSLGTLVLLTTIVSLTLGVFLAHRDNTRLSQDNQRLLSENRRLQQDYGEFVVEDPSKVHAVALASNDAGNAWQWRWRVFVPEDAAYQLNVATGVIAAGGFPKPQSSPPLQPGDNFVSYSIYHNGSEWRQAYRITRGGQDWPFKGQPWMNWNAAGDDTALSYRTDGMTNFGLAEVVQADRGPLVLMRLRAYKMKQPVDPTTVPNGPAPGFLIWIQRAK